VRVLIDTNVVLDLLLEREPFVEDVIAIFEQIERGSLEGHIAATTVTNIFYIIRKAEGRESALIAIRRLLIGLHLCAVDRQTVETALNFDLRDFEDAVQLACATINQLDGVITRNHRDFTGSKLPIYSPTEIIDQVQ
jgi:predicted nucleic acid-binding protein